MSDQDLPEDIARLLAEVPQLTSSSSDFESESSDSGETLSGGISPPSNAETRHRRRKRWRGRQTSRKRNTSFKACLRWIMSCLCQLLRITYEMKSQLIVIEQSLDALQSARSSSSPVPTGAVDDGRNGLPENGEPSSPTQP
nr:unnamed protein product [Spirometra erinaceieuropaei]